MESAASGPTDASAVADLCGIGSNAGLGDDVTNNVDYVPFATSGILNPLLGDFSLNGQVLAFDASLVLQFSVSAIPLNDLQKLNADVSGLGGITAFDASLILQYAAGLIPAFPAASNAHAPGPDMAPVMRMIAMPGDVVAARAAALATELRAAGIRCDTADGASTVGGGSLPGQTLPTRLVRIESASPDRLLAALRQAQSIVVARIADDRVCVDLRTVHEDDDDRLAQAVVDAMG